MILKENFSNPLKRSDWIDLCRNLQWDFKYVSEGEVFPAEIAGSGLSVENWSDWEEPFKTTFFEYVKTQSQKDQSVQAVRDAVGSFESAQKYPKEWLSALKLHAATLPLAEFAAVIGNLRAARFAKHSAWRNMALLGAMDETRHTQIPLLLMHELVRLSPQFDWAHKFYHSKNWVAIAARHMVDELLLTSNPIEFALATNFVFETGFTNLQFIGLSALAHSVGDHAFEKMIKSIQTDEARHAQIGPATLEILVRHDKEYVQYILDKWFWRSWHIFAIVTGFSMDYLTPLKDRKKSFREFMDEWVIDQYVSSLEKYGLKKPWYWDQFLCSLENYHHMVYLSAYSYRATVWFDLILPSPAEREWLNSKYPGTWSMYEDGWKRIEQKWMDTDPGVEFAVHGTSIIGFCDLCQIVLCEGTPLKNNAIVFELRDKKHIVCSEPCRWILEREYDRYGEHNDLVKKVLRGDAPGNLMEMVNKYFGLKYADWGKDVHGGLHPWLRGTQVTNAP